MSNQNNVRKNLQSLKERQNKERGSFFGETTIFPAPEIQKDKDK